MKGTYCITNPDLIECTLKITMPLGDWKNLKSQLDSKHPNRKLADMISRLVGKATVEFEEEQDYDV